MPDFGELHLCLTRMWADDHLEHNITSSDVEFLEGITGNDEESGEKNLLDFNKASFVLEKNVG